MKETELLIGYIDSEVIKAIREDIKSFRNGFPDNSYIWIQYKDESVFVLSSEEIDYMPSLNQNNILYITTWFPYPIGGGDAELYINPKLSFKKQQDIIKENIKDEDGNNYYTYIDFSRNFPYLDFEF